MLSNEHQTTFYWTGSLTTEKKNMDSPNYSSTLLEIETKSSSNQLTKRRGWKRLPTCYFVSSKSGDVFRDDTYTANSDRAKPNCQKKDQNWPILLVKTIDTHDHDNFGSLLRWTRGETVNDAPPPIIWTTTITIWSPRRIELHLIMNCIS